MDGEGGASVALWNQWLPMLSDLTQAGRMLVITRNGLAVIGEYRSFPELAANDRETQAMALDGSLMIDLQMWGAASARHELRANGHCYSLEVSDFWDRPLHKICLTPESDFPLFLELVRNHQASGRVRPASLAPTPPEEGMPDCFAPSDIAGESRPLKLAEVLENLRASRAEIEVRVGNHGAVQSSRFFVEEIRMIGQWLFVSGDETGIHLHENAVERAVWQTLPCCSGAPWKIQAATRNGRVAFEISGTHPVSAR